ncbi:DNA topoisomerase [Clostridia bacterium]|nr:DNA topoisomerase [Clostridia bacterium]
MWLVVAEKPSVAQSIASVLGAKARKSGYIEGNNYIVSWCVGHLIELAQPDSYDEKYKKWAVKDLPIIPDKWKYAVSSSTKEQFAVLKEMMNRADIDEIICATDAGREGELIFRLVYNVSKSKKPFKRLWISSMEESAIKQGFANLKDGSAYNNLYEAALARARADWLIGLNVTRLLTSTYFTKLNVGRVMTPTLSMITEREDKIKNFQKEKFFTVSITDGKFTAESEKITDENTARNLQTACDNSQAVCTSLTEEEKRVKPPKLYDLTTLQREANRTLGFTAQETLNATQSLYEKKLVTYPRTDSQYLTDDMRGATVAVIENIKNLMLFNMTFSGIDSVINSAKVTDHHAIIPTMQVSKTIFSDLPETEISILYLVMTKLLAATSPPHIFLSVSAVIDCADTKFYTRGKTTIDEGFKAVETALQHILRLKPETDKEEITLPKIEEDQTFTVISKLNERFTTPPKHFTEDTLLSAMERAGNADYENIQNEDIEKKGIGTPATRAAIIEKLVSSDFLTRKNKNLLPTEKGIISMTVVPDVLKSPKMTAEWETALQQVEQGKKNSADFNNEIIALTKNMVTSYSNPSGKNPFQNNEGKEVIGVCPRCGGKIYENPKTFSCENCKFAMWKQDKFFTAKKAEITKEIAHALIKDGKIKLGGLYSETKKKNYTATVLLQDTGEYVNYKLDFESK